MPHRSGLSPRKAPRQERSRQMVDRIIDAGERVLVERGYDSASTNRIAKAAGISPGSLYQYFPNKDAIVIAVLDRFADELAERVGSEYEKVLGESAAVAARVLLDAQIRVLEENADLLRIVVEQVPRLGGLDKLAAYRQRITDLTRAYLLLHQDRLREVDLETALWVLVQIGQQMTTGFVLDRPAIAREAVLDELTELTLRYLARLPAPRARA